ncbi:tetratricopeptide repeat protein (macronuclear) [Tetrahymena thermophila SB210]|uniref:Tetratricopeptide repeat protein n=1 Tax=Tetrahymena thermophila (strain SB210) TaxID=312017 RepID=I7M918_TETTS|nr:tetratricopeptide repeat protein [Tetrahymena thermophila SB210]EAS00536.3 tetratricopeptide repeat protein [Tetrahymena thermophila SB210]|eukprot:XP_001020781.3 tetratricopeptide repeat protein [Tetrahymena thermophila SB210]
MNFENYTYIFYVNTQIRIYHKPLKEIEDEVKQALLENPNDVEHLIIFDQILFKYHLDYTAAIKVIKQVLQIQADCIDGRIDLIQIILDFKLSSYEDCFQLLEECMRIDPSYWRIYFTKIRILDNIGDDDEKVMKEVDRCMKLYPQNKYFIIYNAQILSEQTDKREQVQCLLDPYKNSTELDFDLLRRISYAYGNLKQGKEAIEYIKQAIKFNQNSYIAYNEFGYLERSVNNNNYTCLEYCLVSLKLNPRYTFTLNNLAATFKILNKQQECIKCQKKALQLKSNPFSYHQLVYDFYEMQSIDEAKYYSYKSVQKFQQDKSSNFLLQKINRKQFSNTILDYEEQELQGIKCLNFKVENLQQEEDYVETSITQNEVYEDD